MDLTQEELLQVLKLLDRSEFVQLHLEVGDLKLFVSKKGPIEPLEDRKEVTLTGSVSKSEISTPSPAEQKPNGSADNFPVSKDNASPAVEDKMGEVFEEGLVPITAPMMGIFYSRPAPNAPPYVEAGREVHRDDTVGLIEVMKLFTSVKAGVQGEIARIFVESGEMVEYGQTLFLVKPQESKTESIDHE